MVRCETLYDKQNETDRSSGRKWKGHAPVGKQELSSSLRWEYAVTGPSDSMLYCPFDDLWDVAPYIPQHALLKRICLCRYLNVASQRVDYEGMADSMQMLVELTYRMGGFSES